VAGGRILIGGLDGRLYAFQGRGGGEGGR